MFGARPLRRTIARRVASPLSRRILAGEFDEGDTALVGHADGPDGQGEYTFERQKAPAKAKAKAAAKAAS